MMKLLQYRRRVCVLACAMLASAVAEAEVRPADPQAAWLTYPAVNVRNVFPVGTSVPDTVLVLGDSEVEASAGDELRLGVRLMLHRVLRIAGNRNSLQTNDALVIGTEVEVAEWKPSLKSAKPMAAEGFRLRRIVEGKKSWLIVEGADGRGVLYGSFALLRLIAQERPLARLNVTEAPSAPVRWINEWDNPDGSIERGYAGRSIFLIRAR